MTPRRWMLLALLCVPLAASAGRVVERVAAVVNDEIILESEVEAAGLPQAEGVDLSTEAGRQKWGQIRRRYLEQIGIKTLPTSAYRLGRAEFEKSFSEDLEQCAAVVQLLGPNVGKCPPDVPVGFGRLQFEHAKRKSIPILQWRSQDLNIAEVASPIQQELLQLATVQAMPFEEFKRTNDGRIAELEKRGSADALTEEKVSRLNQALDGAKAAIDRANLDRARPRLEGGRREADDEYKDAFAAYVKRGEEKALSVGSGFSSMKSANCTQ